MCTKSNICTKLLPTGWHSTYNIQRCGCRCISYFQARPRHKLPLFHLHLGELRPMFASVIKTVVIVFLSISETMAKKLIEDFQRVEKMLDQRPDLKRHVVVVPSWTQKVESVEYLPGQRRRTVKKEDTVVVQERAGKNYIHYDDCCNDMAQFRLEHPVLARLVDSSSARASQVTCLTAALVDGVYHLTYIAFRCGGGPQLSEGPKHTAPEMLEPTAPYMLEPTAPELEEPVSSELESEDDAPPPLYSESIWGLPPYQLCQDPQPPYEDAVAR